jgi:NADH-quinone oxidoreductase subunit M
MTFPWLTALAALPAAGALVLVFLRGTAAKQAAFVTSLVTLAVAVALAVRFRPGGGMQFTEQVSWISPLGAYYALGLDGIGLTLVLLVAVVTPVVILASWHDADGGLVDGPAAVPAKYDARLFFALVLAVESSALFLFLATDVFLFYVFFEVILFPMYFLIGGFGGVRRAYAASR